MIPAAPPEGFRSQASLKETVELGEAQVSLSKKPVLQLTLQTTGSFSPLARADTCEVE